MKSLPIFSKRIGIAALIFGLSGCAATQNTQEHQRHHPASSSEATSSAMQGGMMHGEKMGMMDMKSMCEMHSKMMNKSPEERQKIMEAHHGNMSPEMMRQHMNMMDENCR